MTAKRERVKNLPPFSSFLKKGEILGCVSWECSKTGGESESLLCFSYAHCCLLFFARRKERARLRAIMLTRAKGTDKHLPIIENI